MSSDMYMDDTLTLEERVERSWLGIAFAAALEADDDAEQKRFFLLYRYYQPRLMFKEDAK